MYKHRLVAVTLALLLISNVALAGDVFWTFQDTGYQSDDTALAMRNGLAWPVIFTGQGDAISLFPAPASGGTSNWHLIGTSLYTQQGRIRASSSPDGRVLVASAGGGGQASVLPYGWTPLGSNTVAAAFDSQGTLYTATDNDLPGLPDFFGGNIVDIAVSDNGDIGVIDDQMQYYQYISWTNTWSDAADLSWFGPQLEQESLDLEFDSLGRPHIVGSDTTINNDLYAFDYSVATGWSSHYLAAGGSNPRNLAVAADSDKLVGTAWTEGDTLYYAYKDDLDPWAVGSVTGGVIATGMTVGIAYDYNDLPVLSFVKDVNIWLAYDPPVSVPEPVSLTMLAFAGAAALLFKRR